MFIKIFEEYYKDKAKEINNAAKELENALLSFHSKVLTTEENASKFRKAWLKFEQQVLLNQRPLQLMVIYRGDKGKSNEISGILNQSDAEVSRGINSGAQAVLDSIEAKKAEEVENFLRNHLDSFIDQLYDPIGRENSKNIGKYHRDQIPKGFKGRLGSTKWQNVYYSNYYSGQGLGQAYDAFMNHIANHNRQVYDYLVSNGKQEVFDGLQKLSKVQRSVFEEEGGTGPSGNFPKLLKDSTNRVGWYTGGDIIIVNPDTMSIVYNIQLKSTSRKRQTVFEEKVAAIRMFIQVFTAASTPQKKAEQLYSFLKTTVSNSLELNQLPQKDIEDLIKTTLQKSGINIE